jgi:E3 ubiquitin-protein ligase HECTD1
MEEFLESCRATSLLAELEDDEELPEADEEDEDENEEDCEDNYDEETSESSRSLLRFHFIKSASLAGHSIGIMLRNIYFSPKG